MPRQSSHGQAQKPNFSTLTGFHVKYACNTSCENSVCIITAPKHPNEAENPGMEKALLVRPTAK